MIFMHMNDRCRCIDKPLEGAFIIGKIYKCGYGIDCRFAIDGNGERVWFDEIKFYWYFAVIKE